MYLQLLLIPLIAKVQTLEVALFPSTGCYSHDVMMRQIGEEFYGDNVSWIQTFIYDFGFGEMPLPEKWERISLWGVDDDGVAIMQEAGSLLWQQNVPTDFERPWDLRGTFSFFRMLERHQTFCEKMLVDKSFLDYVKNRTTDIVVLDHFLQECMGGLSYLLNASVVQFSNWPIADGYITSLNVPANPSSVPKTGTPFSGLSMSFGDRVGNVLFHNIIVITRYIQIHVLNKLFERSGYPEVEIIKSEAERTIYAGRSEFLFDVVRPINNRVKHFGAANCMEPRDYVVQLPPPSLQDDEIINIDEAHLNSSIPGDSSLFFVPSSNTSCDGFSSACEENAESKLSLPARSFTEHLKFRSHVFEGLSAAVVEERASTVSEKFPSIDWNRIAREPFILVSFGSVAQVHNMPLALLRLLLRTFEASSHVIIWQTNTPVLPIMEMNNMSLPDNLMVIEWAPIKELLAHPNLQYIVCHGGINTINELLLFGVPVIGVPLQGDQGSNLRRLADLGAAEVVSTVQMGRGQLTGAMRNMEINLERYWRRAAQLSSMMRFYRTLHSQDQKFWLNWTARNGPKLRSRRIFRLEYIGDRENAFWLTIATTFIVALIILSS